MWGQIFFLLESDGSVSVLASIQKSKSFQLEAMSGGPVRSIGIEWVCMEYRLCFSMSLFLSPQNTAQSLSAKKKVPSSIASLVLWPFVWTWCWIKGVDSSRKRSVSLSWGRDRYVLWRKEARVSPEQLERRHDAQLQIFIWTRITAFQLWLWRYLCCCAFTQQPVALRAPFESSFRQQFQLRLTLAFH